MSRNLTPKEFDRLVKPHSRIIWGAKAIAARVNCSEEFVTSRLAHAPDTPIRKVGRRWCVHEDALMRFFGL